MVESSSAVSDDDTVDRCVPGSLHSLVGGEKGLAFAPQFGFGLCSPRTWDGGTHRVVSLSTMFAVALHLSWCQLF